MRPTPPTTRLFTAILALSCAPLAAAQNGDQPGEEQPPLPTELAIPPAPPLSVEEALESFVLAPGFTVECAASEPLIADPVCIAFDGDGRMWVAEMRAYMPNVDGEGEDEPNGTIAVLEDSDGDGVYDARTDFLEGLVLPRAVMPYRNGALVIAPPELAFHRDTDGDGRADAKEVIATGLGGLHSPEHAINSLRWTHDNWVAVANHRWRFRETEEGWIRQRTNGGGQWGLSLDEEGRAFFNTNSDGLRGDLYSSHYAVRNPNFGVAAGVNQRIASDQRVWPARMTPGVNRGYREPTLRDDYRLRSFTGACGPLIYLGGAFPEEFHGNAFVAEPCGNLVKRFTLHATANGGFEAKNAYEGREFLASRDERFRPVDLYDGPGGALYVVDMYRGLIQHRLFVTSWLRKQVEERGLEEPRGMGRIWRVVHEGIERGSELKMSEMSWTELVGELSSPNGWRRITAQRMIWEDGFDDPDAIDLCRQLVREGPDPMGRRHALLTLAGIGGLDRGSVAVGLRNADPRFVRAALQCAEILIATGDDDILSEARMHIASNDPMTRRQALLSIAEAKTGDADRSLVFAAKTGAMFSDADRSVFLSGLLHRELDVLLALFEAEDWATELPGRPELVRDLARCITREGRHDALDGLFELAVQTAMDEDLGFKPTMGWRSSALIAGMMAGRPKGGTGEPRPIAFAAEPRAIVSARWQAEFNATEPLRELLKWITWPGGPNASEESVRPLSEEEAQRFERGRELYMETCAACHHGSGLGDAGLAPSLRFSSWLLKDAATPIRILVGGLDGPIEVGGETWDLEMPVYDGGAEEVAAVLTYARREWGHGAEPVSVEEVEAVLAELAERGRSWTAEELEAARGE